MTKLNMTPETPKPVTAPHETGKPPHKTVEPMTDAKPAPADMPIVSK